MLRHNCDKLGSPIYLKYILISQNDQIDSRPLAREQVTYCNLWLHKGPCCWTSSLPISVAKQTERWWSIYCRCCLRTSRGYCTVFCTCCGMSVCTYMYNISCSKTKDREFTVTFSSIVTLLALLVISCLPKCTTKAYCYTYTYRQNSARLLVNLKKKCSAHNAYKQLLCCVMGFPTVSTNYLLKFVSLNLL